MNTNNTNKSLKQFVSNKKRISTLILVMVLLVTAILATSCGKKAAQGTLLLQVNPEISIDYDEQGRVLAVTGENNDGKEIVEEYSDFLGKPSKKVVRELVEILDENGYLAPTIDHQPKELTLTITSGSVLPQQDFLEDIATEVTTATQYEPRTVLVVEDEEKSGQKNTAEPITADTALNTALNHAGANKDDISHSTVETDDDEFEVEFVFAGMHYDYEINRYTGKIKSFSSKLWDKESVLESKATEYITLRQVQEVIAQDLGVAPEDLIITKTELELDDGKVHYEVDVHHHGTEIEYHLDAYTGDILKKEQDKEQSNKVPNPATATPKTETTPKTDTTPKETPKNSSKQSSSERLTIEQAKDVVLKHAGVARDQAFFEEVELDLDDGRWEYEIEFHAGGIEYEYDIDAYTGAVLSVEKDQDSKYSGNRKQESQKSQTLISLDQAVNIALSHAGYSASQVKFDDRELDWDDGYPIYEIEFEVGDLEYEYDIDGYTGAILEYEIDD